MPPRTHTSLLAVLDWYRGCGLFDRVLLRDRPESTGLGVYWASLAAAAKKRYLAAVEDVCEEQRQAWDGIFVDDATLKKILSGAVEPPSIDWATRPKPIFRNYQAVRTAAMTRLLTGPRAPLLQDVHLDVVDDETGDLPEAVFLDVRFLQWDLKKTYKGGGESYVKRSSEEDSDWHTWVPVDAQATRLLSEARRLMRKNPTLQALADAARGVVGRHDDGVTGAQMLGGVRHHRYLPMPRDW